MKLFLYIMCALLSSLAYALPEVFSVDLPVLPNGLPYDASGFIISKNESIAYVATGTCKDYLSNKSEIIAVDLKNKKIMIHIKIPIDDGTCIHPEMFLTNDEKKLYVNGNKTIFIIDTTQFKIIRSIKMDKNENIDSHSITSPDKSKIYYNVTTGWAKDYRNFFVFDTQSDSFIDKIPNTKETCTDGCIYLSAITISPDGRYIYELPQITYEKPQRFFSIDVLNKQSISLGIFEKIPELDEKIALRNGLILSKNGDTFYISTLVNWYPYPEDWYIYSLNIKTMELKELYHAEHDVCAMGLSDDEKKLYILDLRPRRKKITIVDTVTAMVIKNIPMDNLTTDAIISKSNSQTIYFTTMPGNGNVSRFNVMELSE